MTVIDPYTNQVLGTIPLCLNEALNPMTCDQIDVHGLGFSHDGHLLDVISVTSVGAQVIDTATNAILACATNETCARQG